MYALSSKGLSRLIVFVFLALVRVGEAAAADLAFSAGYDSGPGGTAGQSQGDAWAGATATHSLSHGTDGPLMLTLDLFAGGTAYARLSDLNQVFVEVSPGIDYVISPRVDLALALSAEGHLVRDNEQSAWGWGGSARLRERLSSAVDLSEYLSYRDLRAREEVYSGTTVAAGLALRVYLDQRWTLGAGCEFARGDFLSGDTQGSGGSGMGRQHLSRGYDQTVVREEEDRVSGSVSLGYVWSEHLSSGIEYVLTRASGDDGGESLHALTANTTLQF